MATGNVHNALDACAVLGIDANTLDAEWAKAKKAGKVVKFGGGFYCGLVEVEGKTPVRGGSGGSGGGGARVSAMILSEA